MPQQPSIYTRCILISQQFLGPAGERFLRRQITTHIGIKPEQLKKRDLPELVEWVSLSLALITKNQEQITSFCQSLLGVGKKRRVGEHQDAYN